MNARRSAVLLVCLGLSGCYSPDLDEDAFRCARPGECDDAGTFDGGVDGGVLEQTIKIRVLLEGAGLGLVNSDSPSFECAKSAIEPVECDLEIAAGTTVRLTATVDLASESSFKAFENCDPEMSDEFTCGFEVGSVERTIRASFGYLLTVATQGPASGHAGTVRVSTVDYVCEASAATTCSNVFIAEELIRFDAVPGDGERVAQWIQCDAASGVQTCTATMSQRQEMIVVFADANCGDGVRDPNDECDDGNLNGGDGCSALCEVEAGYACDSSLPNICTGFIVVPTFLQTTEGVDAQLTVRMNRAPSMPLTVPIAVAAPDVAEATLSEAQLVFTPDDFEATVIVTPTEDNVDEPSKSYTIEFGAVAGDPFFSGVQIDPVTAVKDDNDDPPVIRVLPSAASATEGAPIDFTIELIGQSEFLVSVDYEAVGASAMAGADFVLAPGTATFSNSTTEFVVSVETVNDTFDEPDEIFRLNLDSEINATLDPAASFATGTINDNDLPPVVSISPPSPAMVTEGAASTSFIVFYTVTLSAVSERAISVNWATRNGTANSASGDYGAANGTLNFAPGQTTDTIAITVLGDNADEPDENFYVDLSSATNAVLDVAATTSAVTIIDDDLVNLMVSSQSLAEPGSGAVTMTFTVTLFAATSQVVTVDWAAVSGTATSGSDFIGSGSLNFPIGATSRTLQVTILADNIYEEAETFSVVLSNAVNATINGSGTGTIPANGTAPVFTVSSNLTIMESGAPASVALTVTLTGATQVAASVDWTTANGTAVAPGDYTAPVPATQTLHFPAGTTTQFIIVTIPVDTLDEGDEDFAINLSNPSRATIVAGNTSRTVTIGDNDPMPALSITPAVSVNQPVSGTVPANMAVTLSVPSGREVTVVYRTVGGSASEGSGDYVATNGTTLVFAAGTTMRTFAITVNAGNEAMSEEFRVVLSSPINATVAADTCNVTINP